jgi:hypothetical protein
MPIDRAIEFYLMVSGAIYFVFERLERFSNKADLELYYRMLMIKRENLAPVWREAIIRFFDKLFGAGSRIARLFQGCVVDRLNTFICIFFPFPVHEDVDLWRERFVAPDNDVPAV